VFLALIRKNAALRNTAGIAFFFLYTTEETIPLYHKAEEMSIVGGFGKKRWEKPREKQKNA
jgi:hypothetical protein